MFAKFGPPCGKKNGCNLLFQTIIGNADHSTHFMYVSYTSEMIEFLASLAKILHSGGQKMTTVGGFAPLSAMLKTQCAFYMLFTSIKWVFVNDSIFGNGIDQNATPGGGKNIAIAGFGPLSRILITEVT